MARRNPWQKQRALNRWTSGGLVEWVEGNTAFISVVFTWKLVEAAQRITWHRAMGRDVRVGGPAVLLMPQYLPVVSSCSVDALPHHNPDATFTSRGCVRKCKFCAVPVIEGNLVELADWEPKPIVCDNNLLACSRKHFNRVIDRLKPISSVDFNQGLDARLMTPYHAGRLAELDLAKVRLAWDDTRYENTFMRGFEILCNAGVPKSKISVYVLIGFMDTPEDALYRLRTIHEALGVFPFPMRYQPLAALTKNSFVGEHWTASELTRYMRYWSNLRHLASVPFEEFRLGGTAPTSDSGQLVLPITSPVTPPG